MRTPLARLLCRLGRHDWTFVVLLHLGHLWIARHCRRCHWRDIATPLGREPKGRTC